MRFKDLQLKLTLQVGGSLRIPAAYSGCCGLKPAVGRWPAGGNRPVTNGFDSIKVITTWAINHRRLTIQAVVGPMARSVDELTFQARSMITATVQEIEQGGFADENVIPLPWREPTLPKRLRIGYWIDDGAVKVETSRVAQLITPRRALHVLALFYKPWLRFARKGMSSLSGSHRMFTGPSRLV